MSFDINSSFNETTDWEVIVARLLNEWFADIVEVCKAINVVTVNLKTFFYEILTARCASARLVA